jgi:hypothetical protein
MQPRLQRSQRMRGLTGTNVYFCLDVRADYTPDERENIRRHKLGGEIVYASRKARQRVERGKAHLAASTVQTGTQMMSSLARSVGSLALSRLHLNISVASLARGHHIECRDLEEMMEAEHDLRGACLNVSKYLAIAETFDGAEVIVEFVKGQEREELRQNAPRLLTYEGSAEMAGEAAAVPRDPLAQLGHAVSARLLDIENRIIAELDEHGWSIHRGHVRGFAIAGALLFAVFLYRVL